MMRACKSLKGGLQDVADDLGVRPLSSPHFFRPKTNLKRPQKTGDANRHIPSGRLGLAPDRLHLFQNARALLWRPSRRRRVQRQAVRSRADVFGPERVHGQRARWGDDRGARRPEYREGRAERDARDCE